MNQPTTGLKYTDLFSIQVHFLECHKVSFIFPQSFLILARVALQTLAIEKQHIFSLLLILSFSVTSSKKFSSASFFHIKSQYFALIR